MRAQTICIIALLVGAALCTDARPFGHRGTPNGAPRPSRHDFAKGPRPHHRPCLRLPKGPLPAHHDHPWGPGPMPDHPHKDHPWGPGPLPDGPLPEWLEPCPEFDLAGGPLPDGGPHGPHDGPEGGRGHGHGGMGGPFKGGPGGKGGPFRGGPGH